MIKNVLVLFFCELICISYAVGSNLGIDSLKQVLLLKGTKNLSEERLAEIYLMLSEEYESANTDSLIFYTDKGLELYDKPDYRSWIYLRLLNSKATYYYSEGNFDKAKSLYLELLKYASLIEPRDYNFEATVSMSAGVSYRKLSMTDSTLFYYNKATDLGKISDDKSTLSSIYYNIGAMYFARERYSEALSNAETAAKYAAEVEDINMYMYARILLASAYARVGKFAESSEILKKNVEDALKKNFTLLAMSSFSPLLSTYQLWGKKDSARIYLTKYEKYIDAIPAGSPTALEMLGVRASLYNWMGEHRKSLDILLGNPQMLAQISYDAYNRLLAHNYEALGDYENAFKRIQEAYAYGDSLMKTRVNTEMSELNAKLNLNAKELEISRLENEHARQKAANLRIGIYMGVVIVVLCIIVLILQHKRKIQRKEAELLSAKRYIDGLENERKRLAKDLHDGVCSDLLGVIMQIKSNDVSEEERDRVVSMLEDIRLGVRSISHELMPPSFQFTDLDEMLCSYFVKTERQTGIHIEYKSHSDRGWNHVSHKVGYEMYRIVQEIISNFLKYSNNSSIFIGMILEKEMLEFTVKHNGVWKDDKNGEGIGMRTIDDRLKTIGGKYFISKGSEVVLRITVNLSGNIAKG